MTRLAKAGTEKLAPWTLLAEGTGAFGRPYKLFHVAEGWQVAGSGLRWQDGERWLVRSTNRDGTTSGKYHTTEQGARADFATWTTPIVEQVAR